MNPTSDEQLVILISKIQREKSADELALGFLRYEALRKLSPRAYGELHSKNINVPGAFFDTLVDELIVGKSEPEETKPREQILVAYRTNLLEYLSLPERGIQKIQNVILQNIFEARYAFFDDRETVETDPNKKQFIPYCVLRVGDKILRYTRGSKGGENRLHAKKSIGFGGHINPIDQLQEYPSFQTYLEAVKRELEEEVGLKLENVPHPVCLINDDTNAVGQVHLGFVHVLNISQGEAQSAEDAIESLEEITLQTLKDESEGLETWSQLIVQNGILDK